MATKKPTKVDADKAYHRAEAQRALVFVLGLAESYPKFIAVDEHEERELRENIATVRAHFLTVSAPEPVKTLAGQLDMIDGSVEGGTDGGYVELPSVPPTCPKCSRSMDTIYGGGWTAMSLGGTPGPRPQLQCGGCAFIQNVSLAAWTAVREERRRTIGTSDVVQRRVNARGKKTRGAG